MNDKINIFDYVNNNDQQQRQSHIDLTSECYGYYLTRGGKTGSKAGDLAGNTTSIKKAKYNLLQFLNISDFKIKNIHTCHKCVNDSTSSNFVCINPLHLYFGTQSENYKDIDAEIRKEVSSKAGKIGIQKMTKEDRIKGIKSQLSNGSHITQTISICPHCQKSGKTMIMKRWHFDNCKYKNK